VFALHTDTFKREIGKVVNVCRDGQILLVAYDARQLRGPEKRYSATDLEALTVIAAVEHFGHHIWGRPFTVITYHKALESLLTSKTLNKRKHII